MEHAVELQVVTPPTGRGPVTAGLPWPRGMLTDVRKLVLRDATGAAVRLQAKATDLWPDGSVRWALLDWLAEAGKGPYRLEVGEPIAVAGPELKFSVAGYEVETGVGRFVLSTDGYLMLSWFPAGATYDSGRDITSEVFIGEEDTGCYPIVERVAVEEEGPLRACVHLTGTWKKPFVPFARAFASFEARVHFFAGSAAVRTELTVRNPRRAAHPGGLWDLGDSGSIYLKNLSLSLSLPTGPDVVRCSPEAGSSVEEFATPFELRQESSGGENWRSTNHLNRKREIPFTHRGYTLKSGSQERTGLRATPIAILSSRDAASGSAVGVAVEKFWQNFPMSLDIANSSLILHFLPQCSDVHELQGGEQKTWTFAVAFGPDATAEQLEWFRTPARAFASAEWYCASGAVPYLTPKATDTNAEYLKLVDAAIEGDDTFDRKREVIDEYGWRHFGDIYGDHEAVYQTNPPLVSHYNNQYDPVAGFAYQFLRSGNLMWLRHMEELAQHVIDIDIYHTTEDKSAYNGGLFWHTYHYADADTGTHRSYPRSLLQMKGMPGLSEEKAKRSRHVYAAGGGPANEHNYTTGLMLHYFLTGSAQSREAALGLARWVINLDDGRLTVFRWLSRADTGYASQSRDAGYHGPGRGSGNSLNALVDGHRLSGDAAFLTKAEQLVRRCIHPADDIAKRNLLDVENRWFYTIFLQALGKYLDHKAALGQLDASYAYGRLSLLHYAGWMAEHEVPTLSRPEILEYPNETWAAQDMRKCEVFLFAAKHATPVERAKFLERAEFFFRDSVARLSAFETRTLARPVVLMLSYGWMFAHFQANAAEVAPPPAVKMKDFGAPLVFVPQKTIAKKRAKLLAVGGVVLGFVCVVGLAAWLVLR